MLYVYKKFASKPQSFLIAPSNIPIAPHKIVILLFCILIPPLGPFSEVKKHHQVQMIRILSPHWLTGKKLIWKFKKSIPHNICVLKLEGKPISGIMLLVNFLPVQWKLIKTFPNL